MFFVAILITIVYMTVFMAFNDYVALHHFCILFLLSQFMCKGYLVDVINLSLKKRYELSGARMQS